MMERRQILLWSQVSSFLSMMRGRIVLRCLAVFFRVRVTITVTTMHSYHHERTEKNEQEWPVSEDRPVKDRGQDCEANEERDDDVEPRGFHISARKGRGGCPYFAHFEEHASLNSEVVFL